MALFLFSSKLPKTLSVRLIHFFIFFVFFEFVLVFFGFFLSFFPFLLSPPPPPCGWKTHRGWVGGRTRGNRGPAKNSKKTQKNSKKTEKMKKWSQRTERDFDNFVGKKKVSKSLSPRPKRVTSRKKSC